MEECESKRHSEECVSLGRNRDLVQTHLWAQSQYLHFLAALPPPDKGVAKGSLL